ncbi:hypothetical protein HYR99_05840 [Candidatus Poribacteria bacterium]|nr:hypothetical protein [Candidatus Poribacteria bacterium]
MPNVKGNALEFSRLRVGTGRHNNPGHTQQADVDKPSGSKSAAMSCWAALSLL